MAEGQLFSEFTFEPVKAHDSLFVVTGRKRENQ
jgi:hypothetical protein